MSANSVITNTSVLYIPASVTTLGACAISDCDVSAIIFDSGSRLASISNEGFKRVRASELDLSDAVVSNIGNEAMAESKKLRKVVFSDKVDSLNLGSRVFRNTTSIANIVFDVPVVNVNDAGGQMFDDVYDMGHQVYVQASKNPNGSITVRVKFTSKIWAILPEGYSVLSLTTNAPSMALPVIDEDFNLKQADFRNVANVVPEDLNYYGDGVTIGENITENGKNKGVRSSAVVSVYDTFPTASVEKINETSDANNWGISNDLSNNCIFIDDINKKVTYTLDVFSANNLMMDDLVIINTLPDKGDTMMFTGAQRESDFKIAFGQKSADKVKVDVYIKNGDTLTKWDRTPQYTIEYSDYGGVAAPGQALDKLDKEDWNGGSGHNWSTDFPSNSRSLRVVFKGAAGEQLPPNALVRITYNADIVSTDVTNGDIAWRSFGYQYHPNISAIEDQNIITPDEGTRISAAPLKVGVGVPNELSIRKTVNGESGNPVGIASDSTFRYVIYKGDAVKLSDYSESAIAAALSDRFQTFALT